MSNQTAAREMSFGSRSLQAREMRKFLAKATVTLVAAFVLAFWLAPFVYMITTSLKDQAQISAPNAPVWPAREATFNYEGEDYPVYQVPTPEGVRTMALVTKGREVSSFVDVNNPAAGPVEIQIRWRTLEPTWVFSPQWINYELAFTQIKFGLLFRNTFVIAIVGVVGTLLSCICVAYGFARFRMPGKGLLFTILMATIILPGQVTLIPTYALFTAIGWNGTWLPLIVPHFFANAYNVFLLRQFFLTIPRDLDEAAMIDGASPFRVLISVIIPQSWPAITAVALFHFFFAWNDFFNPLVYLTGRPELQPISVGLQQFNATFGQQPHLIQAGSLMALILPVVVFFFAQRLFMQGVVITGVEK